MEKKDNFTEAILKLSQLWSKAIKSKFDLTLFSYYPLTLFQILCPWLS